MKSVLVVMFCAVLLAVGCSESRTKNTKAFGDLSLKSKVVSISKILPISDFLFTPTRAIVRTPSIIVVAKSRKVSN